MPGSRYQTLMQFLHAERAAPLRYTQLDPVTLISFYAANGRTFIVVHDTEHDSFDVYLPTPPEQNIRRTLELLHRYLYD